MIVSILLILFGLSQGALLENQLTLQNGNIGSFDYNVRDATNGLPAAAPTKYTFVSSTVNTACAPLQTNGEYSEADCEIPSSTGGQKYTWSALDGTFYADGINPGTGYAYYQITRVAIIFTNGDCFGADGIGVQTKILRYTDSNGKDGTAAVTAQSGGPSNSLTTDQSLIVFEAELPASIKLGASSTIGFDIQTEKYCESQMSVTEFILVGVPVETEEPSPSPTARPSTSPTTAEPTMAPTRNCKGEVTWGDPHYFLVSMNNAVTTHFNYQALGWYYYIAPCDLTQFAKFPFFLLSYHKRCWWKHNAKGCISNNMMVLNTKPQPWIIKFRTNALTIEQIGSGTHKVTDKGVNKGTGTQASPISIDTKITDNSKESRALIIEYDDGNTLPKQAGKLLVWYSKGTMFLKLQDVQFDARTRTCNKNEGKGPLLQCGEWKCEGDVIEIGSKGSWTYFTCPDCLRNIACGLMGKYTRGDCTTSDMKDPTNACSQILVGSDGKIYQRSPNSNTVVTTPNTGWAYGDKAFGEMADTWAKDEVATTLAGMTNQWLNDARTNDPGYPNWAKEKNTLFKHSKTIESEGRLIEVDPSDTKFFDTLCYNDPIKIAQVNETCRLNTVAKFKKCCEEIGICPLLWDGCIEDLCACTLPDPAKTGGTKPANITDAYCVRLVIEETMNTTCNVDALYPTATPTNAPTPSPTSFVAGLPQGKKAADLIWLYLIFVVLFVLIAGGAYWYYRKKSGGKASFQNNDNDVEIGTTTAGTTYSQD